MSELNDSYSSESGQNTRVKVNKYKQGKKTVGITLPPKLLEKARKHKLNISRITRQALTSTITYLERKNTQRSFLGEDSFTKEGSVDGASFTYSFRTLGCVFTTNMKMLTTVSFLLAFNMK